MVSYMILEFISWEWSQCEGRYFIVPFLSLIQFAVLVIANIWNTPQHNFRIGNSSHFYRLCVDFGRIDAIFGRLHHAVVPLSALIISFLLWAVKSVKQKLRNANANRVKTILQILVVVSALTAHAVLDYSSWAYRDTIASNLGERNPETVWTLGQIMSFTTWIPVLIGFIYIVSSEGKPSVVFGSCDIEC